MLRPKRQCFEYQKVESPLRLLDAFLFHVLPLYFDKRLLLLPVEVQGFCFES
jgi:hypothetical protein